MHCSLCFQLISWEVQLRQPFVLWHQFTQPVNPLQGVQEQKNVCKPEWMARKQSLEHLFINYFFEFRIKNSKKRPRSLQSALYDKRHDIQNTRPSTDLEAIKGKKGYAGPSCKPRMLLDANRNVFMVLFSCIACISDAKAEMFPSPLPLRSKYSMVWFCFTSSVPSREQTSQGGSLCGSGRTKSWRRPSCWGNHNELNKLNRGQMVNAHNVMSCRSDPCLRSSETW